MVAVTGLRQIIDIIVPHADVILGALIPGQLPGLPAVSPLHHVGIVDKVVVGVFPFQIPGHDLPPNGFGIITIILIHRSGRFIAAP